MCHIFTMDVSYSLQNLLDHHGGFPLVKILAIHDLVEKFPPITQFRYQVQARFAFKYFVKLYYVGMRQVLQDVDFKFETNMLFILECKFVDYLHSTFLTISSQCSKFNFAKCSLTDYMVLHFVFIVKAVHVLVFADKIGSIGDHVTSFLNVLFVLHHRGESLHQYTLDYWIILISGLGIEKITYTFTCSASCVFALQLTTAHFI